MERAKPKEGRIFLAAEQGVLETPAPALQKQTRAAMPETVSPEEMRDSRPRTHACMAVRQARSGRRARDEGQNKDDIERYVHAARNIAVPEGKAPSIRKTFAPKDSEAAAT
jgi:hypothetical protein